MAKITKIYKFLLALLIIFKFSKTDSIAQETPVPQKENKSVSLSLAKKSRIIRDPSENKIIIPDVSIIKGRDLYAMTKKAIDSIGGMGSVVKPGDTVFIKPNYISGGLDGHDPVGSGEVPHPEVVASVAEECLKAKAKEVVIGEWVERPVKINFGGKEGKEGAQVKQLVDILNKKYGQRVHLINLMEHTSYFKFVPSRTKLGVLAIPNIVAEADVIISIPALKTHHKPSPVSLGMKNFMGIMPSVLYGEPRYKLHEAGLHQIIVDINKALRPDLVVISGGFGLESNGASLYLGGKTVDVSHLIGGYLVVAGKDPVATDATATRIITKDWGPLPQDPGLGTPWYVNHLRMAYEQGLGFISSSQINILGEKIEDVAMNWESSSDDVYPEKPGSENERHPH